MKSLSLQTTSDLDQLRESCELECKLAAGRDGKGELLHDFWRSYRFTQVVATNPDDVFGSGSSTIIAPRSAIIDPAPVKNRDGAGRLVAGQFSLPFVDSVNQLVPFFRAEPEAMAELPRTKGKIDRKDLEDIIVQVFDGHYVTIGSLAKSLDRQEKTLRQDYLSKLCKDKRLSRAFPDTPKHEKQAYTKA
jgi:hypothetical protein